MSFSSSPAIPWAGMLFISHIEVSNSVAVGAQDAAFLDFFLDYVQTKPSIDCISNVKRLIL